MAVSSSLVYIQLELASRASADFILMGIAYKQQLSFYGAKQLCIAVGSTAAPQRSAGKPASANVMSSKTKQSYMTSCRYYGGLRVKDPRIVDRALV